MNKKIKIVVFRPTIFCPELVEAFNTMRLIDKTVCSDVIVYVFGKKHAKK